MHDASSRSITLAAGTMFSINRIKNRRFLGVEVLNPNNSLRARAGYAGLVASLGRFLDINQEGRPKIWGGAEPACISCGD